MSEESSHSRKNFWLAVFAVAATYGYFLLFAEFAFLELARAILTGEMAQRRIMGALAAGGLSGSFAAVWRFGPAVFSRRLSSSFFACAAAAGISLAVDSENGFLVAAVAIGLAVGWNTVTLAAGLRAWVGNFPLGWCAGWGTGIAYAFCNLPAVFDATPRVQTWISVVLSALAAAVLCWVDPKIKNEVRPPPAMIPAVRGVAVFFALVSLDSAVFFVIQHTPDLRSITWTASWRLWSNALVHLVAAIGAGWFLGRGWLRGIAGAAWLCLALSCFALSAGQTLPGINLLYVTGVSLYSAALVYFAARESKAWIAGMVFAVAGWFGSAVGIGVAQNLHRPPWLLVALTGAALVFALAKKPALGVLGLVMLGLPGGQGAIAGEFTAQEAMGRQVYIAEGCIHCHSQYVRPLVRTDVERWGPARPLDELLPEQPPLVGNRRQGPDLSHVANRRSPEWNRLHLLAPREVSPGSRMPSYAHLFARDGVRGAALLAYLAALGSDTTEERERIVQMWKPDEKVTAISTNKSGMLFQKICAQCHGPDGRGDGTLASKLTVRPTDWKSDEWRHVPGGNGAILARLIKFGLSGSVMAGHESLSDAEIAGLIRYLKTLHK